MPASEMYDFLSTVTPDYAVPFVLKAQGEIHEEGEKNQIAREGDDGSEERISLSSASRFFVTFKVNQLSESDLGTIFAYYHDPAKANGIANSFPWPNRGDGHTYVVRFAMPFARAGRAQWAMGIPNIKLKILGRVADS